MSKIKENLSGSNIDKVGGFYVDVEVLQWGKNILHSAIYSDCNICVIDEVGKWELQNEGWANSLNEIINSDKKVIIVVRDIFVDDIKSFFNI